MFGYLSRFQLELLTLQPSRTAKLDISCPVEPGKYRVVHTVALPKEIPPGTCSCSVGRSTSTWR